MPLADQTDSEGLYDVCAIGHVSRDVIEIGDRVEELPGGAAYYVSMALGGLGRKVSAITKVTAADDGELLSELRREGIAVSRLESPATTAFENRYPAGQPDLRAQRVRALASPFTPADLGDVRARVFHVGPLTNRDMDLEFLKAVSARGEVSLDVQGLLREVEGGEIVPVGWPERSKGLACVGILKANASEARLLSGEEDPEQAARFLAGLGPREVIVTLGSKGSLVLVEGRMQRIPSIPIVDVVDPTGCGDTYIAGYLDRRLDGEDPERAAKFATALAALKLRTFGPFRGRPADAERLLAQGA